jgi:hypothetical protein
LESDAALRWRRGNFLSELEVFSQNQPYFASTAIGSGDGLAAGAHDRWPETASIGARRLAALLQRTLRWLL